RSSLKPYRVPDRVPDTPLGAERGPCCWLSGSCLTEASTGSSSWATGSPRGEPAWASPAAFLRTTPRKACTFGDACANSWLRAENGELARLWRDLDLCRPTHAEDLERGRHRDSQSGSCLTRA